MNSGNNGEVVGNNGENNEGDLNRIDQELGKTALVEGEKVLAQEREKLLAQEKEKLSLKLDAQLKELAELRKDQEELGRRGGGKGSCE